MAFVFRKGHTASIGLMKSRIHLVICSALKYCITTSFLNRAFLYKSWCALQRKTIVASPDQCHDYTTKRYTRDASPALTFPESPASCSSLYEDVLNILDNRRQDLPGHPNLPPLFLQDYLDLPNKEENRYEYVEGLPRFRLRLEDALLSHFEFGN